MINGGLRRIPKASKTLSFLVTIRNVGDGDATLVIKTQKPEMSVLNICFVEKEIFNVTPICSHKET
jgi:hypothetical protein